MSSQPSSSTPVGWAQTAIWWHVYPLGFVGAPIRPDTPAAGATSLDALLPWLDHVVDLGATGLQLGPVFAASTHGYDSVDQFRIDPRLGDDEAFDRLLAGCRARELRVLLDGVFNHVGDQHPFVADVRERGRDSPHAGLLRVDWQHDEPRFGDFEGHSSLVALDHDNPAVADYVAEVMRFWLARGVDGWRLDAAYAVDPGFWARVLPRVRAEYPHAWFVGEVIHGDYPAIVEESGLDSVTQYELWKATWSSLHDRNFFELDWTLQRHNDFCRAFTPMTFVGNHDVTRIASQIGESKALLAVLLLMSVGGVPSLYYGDEFGWPGVKEDRLGGDDAVRPAFPATPASLDRGRSLEVHRDLCRFRRERPWLATAGTVTEELRNEYYRFRTVASDNSGSVTVELDLSEHPTGRISEDGTVILAL